MDNVTRASFFSCQHQTRSNTSQPPLHALFLQLVPSTMHHIVNTGGRAMATSATRRNHQKHRRGTRPPQPTHHTVDNSMDGVVSPSLPVGVHLSFEHFRQVSTRQSSAKSARLTVAPQHRFEWKHKCGTSCRLPVERTNLSWRIQTTYTHP